MIIIDDLTEDQALTFSGGEEHVKLDGLTLGAGRYGVRKPTSQNLFRLAMVVSASKAAGYQLGSLHIPYFPGARQDRVDPVGTPLAVKVYADFINNLGFNEVVIEDPHSDVTPALVNNVRVNRHKTWFRAFLYQKKYAGPFTFLFPDSGAAKKYYNQYSEMGEIRFCSKSRDPKTGKLSNFQVPDLKDRKNTFIWIIDDICDGGGTFNAIAELVRNQTRPAFLGLAITHGIFSKGMDQLMRNFDHIATTTSISKTFPSIDQIEHEYEITVTAQKLTKMEIF